MATTAKEKAVNISITLPQIAEGLCQLSPREFETLTFLLDEKAMRVVGKSAREAKMRKLREL